MLFRWPSLLLVFLLVSASAAAQDGISKLSIHGYLSQAYAKSDGNQILGVDSEGTTDYRTAALLLRYEMSDFDSFVVQLSNERLGESPFGALREDVTFDWLFYERKIGGSTALRVGKVPNPFGIYAELRDVGILLPFYRPPNSIYQEFFLSETIDGVSVSRDFHGESP